MGSDRARISYDGRQQYRSVVMQQGRVTLEADWNEAQSIAMEEAREEVLDIVGPAGTPDDGYAITFPNTLPAFDFQIGQGTMYVGGERVFLSAPVDYAQQSDWLDRSVDPDFVPLPAKAPGNEYIYLQLREQEVSAVEDSDLKDVALGGPDTAQRTRLIQHIVRTGTNAADCPGALAAQQKVWAQEGLSFDPATMRLNSSSGLQVSFASTGTPTPCDPTAQGGYLGADNQLIRVQISQVQSLRGRTTTSFLWGFDDASFIYRVDVLDPQTLKLQSVPVDAEHQPKQNIAVEVLMASAQLANGEYVAAAAGFVTTLSAGYNPDTQTVSLQSPLPSGYGGAARVFLRVWSEQLTFTAGTAATLGDTGIQVTLSTTGGAPFHVGDYWMFAVRPSTSQQVYPERYLSSPQPPEGPRQWVCPLAVIQWTASAGQVIANCRNPFDNLVNITRRKLGGCCTVNVSPADLTANTDLQTILDRFRGAAGVTVCLMPGTYNLTRPIELGVEHSNYTIEACSGGAVLSVAPGSETAFLPGMVVLNGANSVTFSGIKFQLPLASFGSTTGTTSGVSQVSEVFFSIGLRPVNCDGLTVEDCDFEYTPVPNASLVAVGILAAGRCTTLRIERNRFAMAQTAAPPAAGPVNVSFGFVLMPTSITGDVAVTSIKPGVPATVLSSFLHDAVFRDNLITGLSLPMLVYADCGLVDVESNTVRNCLSGFWFFSLPTLAFANNLADIKVSGAVAETASALQNALFSAVGHPAIQLATASLRAFPVPDKTDLSDAIKVTVGKPAATAKQLAEIQNVFDKTLASVVTPAPPAAPAAAVTQPAEKATIKIGDIAGAITDHPLAAAAKVQLDVVGLNQNLAVLEKQAFAAPVARTVPVAVHASDNDVSNLVTGAVSGFSFLMWSLGRDDKDGISLTGNSLVGSNGASPVALLLGVSRSMVTGNMVLNEAARLTGNNIKLIPSLWLFPFPAIDSSTGGQVMASAITGNVFRGAPILPVRNLTPAPAPPMNTWDFFNSEV